MVTGGAASEGDGTSSIIRVSPHNERDKRSMEMDNPQGAGQATPVVNISVFGEAPLSIAECSHGNLSSYYFVRIRNIALIE
jgi:hypothetical protein